ncbi:MAG: hypothetical protein IH959_00450 [Chloroflexi bacterium]|nr:hypothetical protein [Chloroflexota bacterium]
MTHNVYVVELDRKILREDQRFVEANPNHNPRMKCLYVGMTGRSPAERYKQHKAGYKASRRVRKHGVRLVPGLYRSLNPMTYDQAVRTENSLTRELRSKGYAVWQH